MSYNNAINNTSEPLTAGNLKMEGNVISSTNVNGDINLEPVSGYSFFRCHRTAFSGNGNTSGTRIRNSDNSDTASDAHLSLKVNGDSNSNPYTYFNNAINTWTAGLDNDESDRFSISASTGLGTTDVLRIATDGNITKPLQPAFAAYNSSTDVNQFGNSGFITIDFDTEIFDLNGDFSADIFTSSVDGQYRLTSSVIVGNISTCNRCQLDIITSNRLWAGEKVHGSAADDLDHYCGLKITALVDMDSGDTAYVRGYALGEAANTLSVMGTGSPITYFCGYLAT